MKLQELISDYTKTLSFLKEAEKNGQAMFHQESFIWLENCESVLSRVLLENVDRIDFDLEIDEVV